MATCPPLLINPPATTPAVGGLFTAATPQEVPSEGDGRRWECGGIQYQAETCATPEGWVPVCPPAVPVLKNPTLAFPLIEGDPFLVELGVTCRPIGVTVEELRRRVINAFVCNEQRVAEQIYWTGEMGNNHLADPTCTDLTPDGGALSIVGGIAALESFLASNYCGVGVLHAPRGLVPFAAAQLQIEGPPNRLTTKLGTRWAFGAGYAVNTGPDGIEAPAGEAWIYATGQVNIWRSEVFVNPDQLNQAYSLRTNEATIFAERNYAITSECVCAAIRVVVACQC